MASIDITGGAPAAGNSAANIAAAAQVEDEMAKQMKPLFLQFLNNYQLPHTSSASAAATRTASEEESERFYVQRAKVLRDKNLTTLQIDFTHILEHNADLARAIKEEYYRLAPYLQECVVEFVREHIPDHHAIRNSSADSSSFRPAFYDLGHTDHIRDLKTSRIGTLMSISGTVTRTSAVRPELSSATFRCQDCKVLQHNILQQFKYTEPVHCINPACENRARWTLDTVHSKFQDWQLVRIQENSDEIPPGSMPRSMKIVLRHEEVEHCKPGDKVVFTGTLIVIPDIAQLSSGSVGARISKGRSDGPRGRDRPNENNTGVTGLKSLGVRDVSYSLCFLACTVSTSATSVDEIELDGQGNPIPDHHPFTPVELDKIHRMKTEKGNLYTRMVESIAPNIFGHNDIKRGVLLMLLGGVHKKTADGQNLRGDINVCIVGDPSTSKSQFLKYVCTFLPRAVYTSGKASSAAGLTASIARDPETGDFAIEAGALMLADNGICCIDEFDKMEPADQVAIHEAMEQQTISIAKAGIQATLNARTSILAAANPIKGRYDPSRTLKQNVDISAPIMSRFDLFFVVLDEGDQAIDYNIARHIVNVHTGKDVAVRSEFELEDLQLYIRYARTTKPKISAAAMKDFVDNYTQLRGNDSTGASKSAYRITVRQLESMIRLAEARARLDLAEEVTSSHVKEAARLLKMSIVHVENRDVNLDEDDEAELYGDVGADGHDGDDNDDDQNGGGHSGNGSSRPPATPKSAKKGKKPARESKEPEPEEEGEERKDGGVAPMETDEEAAPAKKPSKDALKLSFNEYQRLTLLIVRYLREKETIENPSMSWAQLVNDFIAENFIGEQRRGPEDLVHQIRTLELVIHRLIKTDHILLLLKKSKDKAKRMLKVHPNFTGENGIQTHETDDQDLYDLDQQPGEGGDGTAAAPDGADAVDEAVTALRQIRSSQPAPDSAAATEGIESEADQARMTDVDVPSTPKASSSGRKTSRKETSTPAKSPAKTPSSGRSQRSKK